MTRDEVPEADALEQERDAVPPVGHEAPSDDLEAPEADALDQARAEDLDDDEDEREA